MRESEEKLRLFTHISREGTRPAYSSFSTLLTEKDATHIIHHRTEYILI